MLSTRAAKSGSGNMSSRTLRTAGDATNTTVLPVLVNETFPVHQRMQPGRVHEVHSGGVDHHLIVLTHE